LVKRYIYFPYTPTQPISKNVKKQEILWYELIHNYIPFLLKTSKGTRNFIRSMTLYVSMLFHPLYEVAKRCDCKIKFFHDPTVLLLWHPIQPPPKQHFQAGNKIIFINYWYYCYKMCKFNLFLTYRSSIIYMPKVYYSIGIYTLWKLTSL
jgi:hypothetical protein